MARFSCSVRVLREAPPFPIRLFSLKLTAACLHELDSTDLVPGDVFAVERGLRLPCDGILLVGTALIDESMMTGETKPVYKSALPSDSSQGFSFSKGHKHVLYGGSEVRYAGNLGGPALCLVVKTGFSTEQGRMMRSLVHPVGSSRMNFERETWKFVGLLALLSTFTFSFTLYQGIENGLHPMTIFKRSIDTVTIAVPPALPIIISVGILCAQDALRRGSGTRCLNPSRINVAGRATVVVFDKTGTLTEDDEDLLAVLPSSMTKQDLTRTTSESSLTGFNPELLQTRFPRGIPFSCNPSVHASHPHLGLPEPQALPLELVVGLATCHSLGFVDDELIGDPLEFQMFNFTGWNLYPPKHQNMQTDEDECEKSGSSSSSSVGQNCEQQQQRIAADAFDYCGCGASSLSSSDVDPVYDWDSVITVSPPCLYDVDDVTPIWKDRTPIWKQEDRNSTTDGGSTRCREQQPHADLQDACSDTDCSPEVVQLPNSVLDVSASSSYAILRVFEFDPNLQRMSVMVGNKLSSDFRIYAKGAPEKIKTLCRPESIPLNWDVEFSAYAEKGLRVLAIAQKSLGGVLAASELQRLQRLDVESDLTFLGFLLFSNLLRPDSAAAINDLQSAGCCVYMATGDGPVTASAIGFQAGILPPEVEDLASGVLIDGQLRWQLKPFGCATSQQQQQHQISSNSSTQLSEDSSVIESDSLLRLIEGKCLSKVGLSLTGEALRHIVVAKSAVNSDLLSALDLDRFQVDAFCLERRKSIAAWLACKQSESGDCDEAQRKIWDKKPRTMCTLEFVLRYAQIFSRMSPDDKALLIQQLQSLSNYPIVGMCGDGANDCAALKASDVGISLSAKEASVAAPFNCSKQKTICVVLDVLREGRGALTNSIQNFQYVALYAMIQLCSVTILSHFGASLADGQFLYLDLWMVLPLSYFMSWSQSSAKLARVLPPQSLLAGSIVVSLVGQVVIQVLFQLAAVFVVLPYVGGWFYTPFEVDLEDESNFFGYENTVTFMVSNIQTVVTALILALGTRPWKIVERSFYFLFVWAFLAIIGFALVLNEAPYVMWLRRLLSITSLPLSFRTILLLTVSINILASFVLEQGVVQKILRRIETRRDNMHLNRESLRAPGVDEMVLKSSLACDSICVDIGR